MSFIRPSPSFLQSRTFSGTACALRQSRYKKVVKPSPVPDYPYGPSTFYKQSNLGLYGQQKIRYGNMVSEKNEIKTRRYWRPNVQRRRLWSDSLGSFIKIRVTTRVLRTIDKCGGLDEYLLGEKAARIKDLGVGGWNLRWRIMQTDKVKERFRLQREAAGLPPKEEASVGSDGLLMSEEQVEEQIRRYDQELEKGSEVDIEDGIEGEFIQEELDQPEKRTL